VHADDEVVADVERAVLDEHRGDRTLARIELGLDDGARGAARRVRLEVEDLGLQDDLLEQLVDVRALLRRDGVASTLPPNSSSTTLCWSSSCLTRSGLACGRSTLLIATTIGTPAFLACEMASIVCGMRPSSAATTSTTMSVTCAPRARMAVNASWPGVSRKVIARPPAATRGTRRCAA
jgi:hypothetical protein